MNIIIICASRTLKQVWLIVLMGLFVLCSCSDNIMSLVLLVMEHQPIRTLCSIEKCCLRYSLYNVALTLQNGARNICTVFIMYSVNFNNLYRILTVNMLFVSILSSYNLLIVYVCFTKSRLRLKTTS